MKLSPFRRHRFRYQISLPRGDRAEVLSRLIAPAMLRLKEKISSWFVEAGKSRFLPGRQVFYICLRPRSGVSPEQMDAAFALCFEGELERRNGRIESALPAPEVVFLKKRFGGERGMRLYEMLAPRQTRLVLDMLALRRARPDEVSVSELALAALFLHLREMTLSVEEQKSCLSGWLSMFAEIIGGSERLPEIRGSAASEIERESGLSQAMDFAYQGEAGELGALLKKNRSAFRRIGRLLAAHEEAFQDGNSRLMAIMNAHVHVVFLNLGVDNWDEIAFEAMALEWLNRKKPGAAPTQG